MSDVMKAMHRLLNEKWGLLHYDPDDLTHGESVLVENIQPLTDHIGELHSAIARLKGEHERVCKGAPSNVGDDLFIGGYAFADLFDLLPTDWAGDEG